ncbi:MAG TPA: glycoside hydrolase family 43 protein [Acidimicrobiia bacterium]
MTTLLEQVDALPRPPVRRRTSRWIVAVLAVAVTTSAVVGGYSMRLHSTLARERRALEAEHRVEALARRRIADTQAMSASVIGVRGATLGLDRTRRQEYTRAYAALVRIEHNLATTNQALASTEAIQIQVGQYSAQRDACIRGVRDATSALQGGNPSAAITALRAADQPCAAALAAATGARYPYDFPDPSILTVGSRYYAYSTNAGAGNIQVLVSSDLAHWSIVGDGLAGLPGWASPGATWAPTVIALGTSFVAYYTTRDIGSGLQCVSVATSASPAGPFVDASKAPLVCQAGGSIDPSAFVDDSGTPWLLWKSEATATVPSTIWSQPLAADGVTIKPATTPTPLLTPGQSWEHGVVEGPSMIRIDGRDYLFYSGGFWTTAGYAEGVVTCDGPAGPCRRIVPGPVLASAGRLAGPGGAAAFRTPRGNVWLAFHAFTQPDVGYPNSRTLHLATVRISNGVPIVTPA